MSLTQRTSKSCDKRRLNSRNNTIISELLSYQDTPNTIRKPAMNLTKLSKEMVTQKLLDKFKDFYESPSRKHSEERNFASKSLMGNSSKLLTMKKNNIQDEGEEILDINFNKGKGETSNSFMMNCEHSNTCDYLCITCTNKRIEYEKILRRQKEIETNRNADIELLKGIEHDRRKHIIELMEITRESNKEMNETM